MAVSKEVSSLFVLLASVMFVLAAFDGTKAQASQDALATKLPYDPASINWDMSGTACAAWGAGKTLGQRQFYEWAAFCRPDPPLCGSCLQVTNRPTRRTALVRMVDQCSMDGGFQLQLENSVLQRMGSGDDGDLVVAYDVIDDCASDD